MAENGCGDSGQVHEGDLQSHWGGRIGVHLWSGLFKVFGADNALSRRGLDGGTLEIFVGETSLGVVREVAKAGRIGTNHLGKVLLCGGLGGATIWV